MKVNIRIIAKLVILIIMLSAQAKSAFSQCGSIREDDRYQHRGSWDVLVLIVDWPDRPATTPFDLAKHQETARQIDEWFQEQSMCRMKVNFIIVDQYIRMPHPTTHEPYLGKNDNAWKLQMNDAIAEAQKINPDYSLANYTVFMDFPVATTFSGYGGLGRVWSPFTNGKVARHELAHVFHINHEDNPEGDIGNVLGPFSRYRASWIFGQDEYGFKSKWFYTAGGIGEYRLYDYRSSKEVPQGLRMMRVQNKLYDLTSTLNIFYDGNPGSKGVVMYEEQTSSLSSLTRLDHTPNSKSNKLDDFNDGNLQVGQNYYYSAGNIRIDVVREVPATATAPAYVEMNVKYGSSPPENDLSNVFLKSLTTNPTGEFKEPFDKRTTGHIIYLPEGTTTVPVITAIPEDPNATVTITPARNVTGNASDRTAKITVKAQDGITVLWYFVEFWVGDPPKGTDAHLFQLNVSQGNLEPEFYLFTFNYNVALPLGTSVVPDVIVQTNDPKATYVVTKAKNLTGSVADRTTRVVVTAENGINKKTYEVVFSLSSSAISTNANLATLTTSQGTLSPAFNASTTNYTVSLPTGTTTVPAVSATAADAKATVAITQAANLTGSAAQRTATVVVTAEDGTTKTYTVVFSIESTTPDFTLNATNTSLSIPQGAFGTTDIGFSPTGGFSGTVALSIDASTPLPSGVTATFTPPSISSGSSTLRFDVDATAAPVGPVSITVRGVSGSISQTVDIDLTITEVTEPTFTLNATPQSLTIAQGGGGEIDVTITALAGFDQEVELTYNLTKAGVSASFNPVFISGEGESLLSIIVEEDADLGAAELTITATSGTIVRTVSISLQVEPPPVEIYPANQFSPNGDGIDDTWQITDIEKAPQLVISVFNRVGQVVFRTKAYQNDWDGTSNGRQLLPATYFYVIRNEKGENVETGSVNLIR